MRQVREEINLGCDRWDVIITEHSIGEDTSQPFGDVALSFENGHAVGEGAEFESTLVAKHYESQRFIGRIGLSTIILTEQGFNVEGTGYEERTECHRVGDYKMFVVTGTAEWQATRRTE